MTAAGSRAKRYSDSQSPDYSWQAIAKAEAVTGNAARLVRAPTLCLCKAPERRDLAARMLLVSMKAGLVSSPVSAG
jgi:hypothetical protein